MELFSIFQFIQAEHTKVDEGTEFFYNRHINSTLLECCCFDVYTACHVTCQTLLTFCIPWWPSITDNLQQFFPPAFDAGWLQWLRQFGWGITWTVLMLCWCFCVFIINDNHQHHQPARWEHEACSSSVTLCNKLEIDGQRISKCDNKCHYWQQQEEQ